MDIEKIISIGIRTSINNNGSLCEMAGFFDNVREKVTGETANNYFFGENRWTFKTYKRHIFESIRCEYDISNESYIKSFGEVLRYNENTGKSGSFFYITSDKKFIIKTIYNGEYKFLTSILKKYSIYLIDNKDTYLTKFYGLYKIKTVFSNIKFVVMNNIFYNQEIKQIYDLKGTTEDRLAVEDGHVLKDLNFEKKNQKLYMDNNDRDVYCDIVKKDTEFLEYLNIMDYSLILGIGSDIENGVIVGMNGETYVVGIIDILQDWSFFKIIARIFKKFFHCYCYDGQIDSEPPEIYRDRFINYVTNEIIIPTKDDLQPSEIYSLTASQVI